MLNKVFRVIFTICGMLFGYGASTYLVENSDWLSVSDAWQNMLIVVFFTVIFGLIFYNILGTLSKSGEKVATSLVSDMINKVPATELASGCIGLLAGLLIAYLLSPIINEMQGLKVFYLNVILTVLLYLILGTLGVMTGRSLGRDFKLPSIGGTVNSREQTAKRKKNKGAVPKILDTSVIIDGRIVDILKTGFIEGDIVIPEFVLVELRHIADSSDSLKRNRGRRGLDILNRIQTEYGIEIYDTSEDKTLEDIPEVDVKLLKLAQSMKGMVMTNDFNLNKVAKIQGVGVLNINELVNSLKPVVLPGEKMNVFLVKEGKENNQAVAYMDDGTMIVVESGRKYIGSNLDVTVTSVLQTSAGRMIFAKPL